MPNSETARTLPSIALVLMIGYHLFDAPVLLHLVTALLFLSAFPSRVSRALVKSWLKFSEVIGFVNSRIILTLVYFVVLVPVSFCYRRFNRKSVEYFEGRNLDSYFLDSSRSYNPEIFEKTW